MNVPWEEGDNLLATDGEPNTGFRDIQKAFQCLDASKDDEGKLRMKIFREGSELDLLLGTEVRDGFEIKQIVNWCD